jgi:hypothetical protein
MERVISNYIKLTLNNNKEAERELNLIKKVIDYSVEIAETCTFEVDCPSLYGDKYFTSVEEYKEKDDYWTAEAAVDGGVSWDGDTNFCGSFSWSGCPEVSVQVEGLTEYASEEAKTLWEAQSKEQGHQQKLDRKRQRLERTHKELLKLQAELAAAETNA